MALSTARILKLIKAIKKNDLAHVVSLMGSADLHGVQINTLYPAILTGNVEMVSYLRSQGATLQVYDGRYPVEEAFKSKSKAMLAAVLQCDATAQSIAQSLRGHLGSSNSSSADNRRQMANPAWEDVWVEYVSCSKRMSGEDGFSWWKAIIEATPTLKTIEALEATLPLGKEDNAWGKLLAELAPSNVVLEHFKKAGWLDAHVMLEKPMGAQLGMLGYAFHMGHYDKETHTFLNWMLDHAAQLPEGQAYIKLSASFLVAHALGKALSMPLAKKVCALAKCSLPETLGNPLMTGETALHLVMQSPTNEKCQLKMITNLLNLGADPMAKNFQGQPAGYRVLFLGKSADEVATVLIAHGADLSLQGPVGQYLLKACPDPKKRLQSEALLAKWDSEAQAHKLHANTASVQTRPRHRF